MVITVDFVQKVLVIVLSPSKHRLHIVLLIAIYTCRSDPLRSRKRISVTIMWLVIWQKVLLFAIRTLLISIIRDHDLLLIFRFWPRFCIRGSRAGRWHNEMLIHLAALLALFTLYRIAKLVPFIRHLTNVNIEAILLIFWATSQTFSPCQIFVLIWWDNRVLMVRKLALIQLVWVVWGSVLAIGRTLLAAYIIIIFEQFLLLELDYLSAIMVLLGVTMHLLLVVKVTRNDLRL